MTGKVKVVNSRGYGFIETDSKIDYFFHHTQFHGDWKKLVAQYVKDLTPIVVEFENDPIATDGPRAINIKVKSNDN